MLSDVATQGSTLQDKLKTTPQSQIQEFLRPFQKPDELFRSRSKTSRSSQALSSTAEGLRLSARSVQSSQIQIQPLGDKASLNNTLATAQRLGTLVGRSQLTWKDSIASTNTSDFFQFNLSRRTRLRLSLNDLTANADLQLLDATGQVIRRSQRGGKHDESIRRGLKAGTYYLEVNHRDTANADYTLNLQGTGPTADPGDALDSALNVADLLGTRRVLRDSIGGQDQQDLVRFNLVQAGNVNLYLDTTNSNTNFRLLNSQGGTVAQSLGTGSRKLINRTLGAGSYYIQIFSSSFTKASLTLNMSASPRSIGPSSGTGGGGSTTPGSSGGTSSNPGSSGGSGTTIRPYIRVTKTNQYDGTGLMRLNVELLQGNKAIDRVAAVSGQPGKQYFRVGSQSRSGSLEPLPEGKWNLGNLEWASGKPGDFSRSWPDRNDGLGPIWVSMTPTFSTTRSAIGFHLDNNANRGLPGTSGCVGLATKSDLNKFVSWFGNPKSSPKVAYVDWGLGTLIA